MAVHAVHRRLVAVLVAILTAVVLMQQQVRMGSTQPPYTVVVAVVMRDSLVVIHMRQAVKPQRMVVVAVAVSASEVMTICHPDTVAVVSAALRELQVARTVVQAS